ncbi:nucleotidyltransferase [Fusobacterium sp.]|uniref:nucleotidyltransferase n=1 Tax=Fusobacterium sp. TaxID=68766 RepID=UPI00262243AB|nr:nucleotidyltransferase [Fusobacterium sp.]
MNSVGIIVEYNPFHNGHKYHLEKSKEKGDIVVAVMSGDFVQRGEPAFLNRWERGEIALREGVDILVELPVFYSVQSAEIFARGAVGILNHLGVKKIIFGSESSDIEKLKEIIALEKNEKFIEILQNYLKEGDSYPTAYNRAIEKFVGKELSFKSNDILGIEYLRAIEFWKSEIIPYALKREGVGYYSCDYEKNITSATGIRKMFEKNEEFEKIEEFITENSKDIVFKAVSEKRVTNISNFYNLIRYAILSQKENLKNIQDIEIGLDNRLYEMALTYENYEEFLNKVITKRFTIGRVQRVLIHILLGITKEITEQAKNKIPYIRVMGFSEKGREYLKKLKDKDDIKVITSLKNIQKILSEEERKFLEINERAGKIYGIVNPYKNRNIPLMERKMGEKR